MAASRYDAAFYANQADGSLRAARAVLPLVLDAIPVRSAVDVGCGVGAWLRVLAERGATELDGYDGDYVDRAALLIDPARFHAADLREFAIPRRYDLALSLEVAEHLPPEAAAPFVARLTEAAPAVLFSAAIPGQGGTGHVNERWQDFWRGLFAERGLRPVDAVRPAIAGSPDVPFWYQQNVVLYCDAATLAARPALRPVPDGFSLNFVHPALYEQTAKRAEMTFFKALRMLPRLALQAGGLRAT